MILYMIDTEGRARIGQFVTDEIYRQGTSAAEVGDRPGKPSLPTIKRIKAGDPRVSEGMLRALGAKLGLPNDYLIYVGTGDIRRIEQSGASADLIRVTVDMIRIDPSQRRNRMAR